MSSEMQDKIQVAVIGGGIGGLCTAIGLMELPHLDVQIYEAAHEFGEVGLGVNIAPNAQRALAMISPKTEAAYLAEATPNGWPSHKNIFTTVMCGYGGADEGKIITQQTNEIGMRSVHRAKFLSELVKNIPTERAHFNKRLVKIDTWEWREKLLMHFKDGTTAQADCVIGADGIHSVCRRTILGDDHPLAKPQFTGTACFRSLIPMDKAVEKLGAEFAQNCYLLCGPGAAIFSYPVEHGADLNIIMMDFGHPKWEGEKWIRPTDHTELQKILKGWGKQTENLIDLMDKNDLTAWAMHDAPIAPTYCYSRLCIIGDAAHATTPFQGQGAGQAIEDALTLKALFSEVKHVDEVRHAFTAYDLARRARTGRVCTTSRESGLVQGFLGDKIGSDIVKMKEYLDLSFRWLWNRDLEAQNAEAVRLFKESFAQPEGAITARPDSW